MEKKLNIVFCSFPDFAGNAKPLYEYIKKEYPDKFNLFWVVTNDLIYNKLRQNNVDVFIYQSEEYYNMMKSVDIIFTTHCNLISDKPEKAIYVELWHGVGLKPIGYLIKNMSDFDISWYDNVHKYIDYMIVPSDFWRSLFSSMFKVDPNRILPLGLPKLDEAILCDAKHNLELLLNINLDNYNKIIFYTPTLSKNSDRNLDAPVNNSNVFNFDPYNEQILFDFLEKNNYLLCIKLHPSETNYFSQVHHKNIYYITEEALSNKDMSIYSILNAADLLISDYSSLAIEFTYFQKPTIFLNNNFDIYSKNRGIIFENLDFWCSNNSAKTINELFNKIINITSTHINNSLLNRKSLWFSNIPGSSCKNICNYFFNNYNLHNRVKKYVDPEIVLQKNILRLDNQIESLTSEARHKNQIIDSQEQIINAKDEELTSKNEIINAKIREINLKDEIINVKNNEIKKLNTELDIIINSRGWKLLEKLRKIIRKLKLH